MAEQFQIPHLSLDDVVQHLADSHQVVGVLAMGSTGKPSMKPYSDYDLAIILAEDTPHLFSASIWIDQQLGDLYFFSSEEINILLANTLVETESIQQKLLDWVQTGTILYDPEKLFEQLREIPSSAIQVKDPSTFIHSAWFGVNFNYAHNKRYFNSGKELYLQALEMRLLYCTSDLLVAYYNLRGIPWRGEKSAIIYLKENDPEFLELYMQRIRGNNLNEKFHNYALLVEKVLDGYGGVWADDECSVTVKKDGSLEEGVDWLSKIFVKN